MFWKNEREFSLWMDWLEQALKFVTLNDFGEKWEEINTKYVFGESIPLKDVIIEAIINAVDANIKVHNTLYF